jgi:hypothetical protein
MSDWVHCCGDIAPGDALSWIEHVWGGSRTCPRVLGDRGIIALVLRDSYGADCGQHTLTLRVLASGGYEYISTGLQIRRKARTLYGANAERLIWSDETARAAALTEKHARGDAARARRVQLREAEFMERGGG